MTTTSHDRKVRKLGLLGLAAAVLAGLALGRFDPGSTSTISQWVLFPAILVLMAGVVLAGIPWWRALDDVQKQGQTHSWYWGSLVAGLAALAWLLATTGRHSDLSLGAAYLFVAQGVGFALAWLLWRLKGRGAAE